IALMIMSAAKALTTGVPSTETPIIEGQKDQALAPEALAKKSGCLECHSVDKKLVGPSYRDIAARYKGDSRARAALIEKVKNGGKGNGTGITRGVPMPPHSRVLSTSEIERLVDWVLSLKGSN